MLISILSLVGYAGSTDYFVLCAVDFPFELEIFCFLGFFLGLGIKIPLFPCSFPYLTSVPTLVRLTLGWFRLLRHMFRLFLFPVGFLYSRYGTRLISLWFLSPMKFAVAGKEQLATKARKKKQEKRGILCV